jgi:sulfate/thiosulfate transport system ATP-binding protein
MSIEVKNISKSFGNFQALKNVSLKVPTGELVALLGPSGCGKTTLLRIIAGLEKPETGAVYVDEKDTTHDSVRSRQVGFVFQHYALFRHMTVFDNVAFGLKVRPKSVRPSKEEIREKVTSLLKLVQLDWLADRYPSQLSGGQRQRIALARALAVEPRLLLLDEPFGALDAKVRKELRKWLRELHDKLHITSVFVTHDQEEAMELANYVVVMNQGEVIQMGTPEEVYHHPATPFVYNFLGNVNLFHGRIEDGVAYIGDSVIPVGHTLPETKGQAFFYIRPNQMVVDVQPNGDHCIKARIQHINPAGPQVKLDLITPQNDQFEVQLPHETFHALQLGKGGEVFVSPKEAKIFMEDYVI